MKIGIATVQVPFVYGGAEFLAKNLQLQLVKRGYDAEIISIPFKWYPTSSLKKSIQMARFVDLTETNGSRIDMLITLKFPMYYTQHHNKVLWLLHQHRQAYDLWGTEYGDLDKAKDGKQVKQLIINYDNQYIPNHKKIFTISSTVSERLLTYNRILSEPLYHPPFEYEKFYCNSFRDYVFYPSRINPVKRQEILIEALHFTKTPIRAVIAGKGNKEYVERLASLIKFYNLEKRVELLGYISEQKKVEYFANCLCVYNGPFQEDYGYVTLEAFFSGKPVITHFDSHGPLEFVEDYQNGFIIHSSPMDLAEKLDYFYWNKNMAMTMGGKGMRLMGDLQISWDDVIRRLIK